MLKLASSFLTPWAEAVTTTSCELVAGRGGGCRLSSAARRRAGTAKDSGDRDGERIHSEPADRLRLAPLLSGQAVLMPANWRRLIGRTMPQNVRVCCVFDSYIIPPE